MSQYRNRAVGAERMPDMDEWWKEGTPRQARPRSRAGRVQPPVAELYDKGPRRSERRKVYKHSRLLMYMTLVVFMVCLFMQINRYAQLASQTKQISQLTAAIKQLDTDKSNLELRLSARENISRVRDEAIYNLGMNYPSEGQVRVIAFDTVSPDALSQIAANSADSAQ